MRYREWLPPEAHRALVQCYWSFELGSGDPPSLEHAIVPDGTVSLAAASPPDGPAGSITVVGPRVTALRLPVFAGLLYSGIRLQPGAAGALLGVPVRSLREQVLPLTALPGARAAQVAAGLAGAAAGAPWFAAWEAWLARERGPQIVADPVVSAAAARLHATGGTARIGELAARSGLGERQFRRRFFEATGLTPKEYARMRRLRDACIESLGAQPGGWAAVAAEAGFADQPHLAREFLGTFGWPPSLVQAYLGRIEHVGLVRETVRDAAAAVAAAARPPRRRRA